MNTKKETFHFIILIPHRDAVKYLDEYRQKLFSLGVSGAFSFPAASPLAELREAFNREELKELGINIRRLSAENNSKILTNGTNAVSKSSLMSFFGPVLSLLPGEEVFPQTARGKIIDLLNPAVLCAAIVHPMDKNSMDKLYSAQGPLLSFRSAALANLAIRPLETGASQAAGFSYEWKISLPVWLSK